jgi:hypothetical protein
MERVTRCLYGEAPSERASEQHSARSRGLRSSLQKEGIAEIYVRLRVLLRTQLLVQLALRNDWSLGWGLTR